MRSFIHYCNGYELIHHRVTQGITEFNQFEIKRIELRETLCYSVAKTHYRTVRNDDEWIVLLIIYNKKIKNVNCKLRVTGGMFCFIFKTYL